MVRMRVPSMDAFRAFHSSTDGQEASMGEVLHCGRVRAMPGRRERARSWRTLMVHSTVDARLDVFLRIAMGAFLYPVEHEHDAITLTV